METPPPHSGANSPTKVPRCCRALDFNALADDSPELSTESEPSSSKNDQNETHENGMIEACPSNEYIAEFIDSPSTSHQVPAPSAQIEPSCATPVVKASLASKFTNLGVVRAKRKSDGSSLATIKGAMNNWTDGKSASLYPLEPQHVAAKAFQRR